MYETTLLVDVCVLGIAIGIVIYQLVLAEYREYVRRHPSMNRLHK